MKRVDLKFQTTDLFVLLRQESTHVLNLRLHFINLPFKRFDSVLKVLISLLQSWLVFIFLEHLLLQMLNLLALSIFLLL